MYGDKPPLFFWLIALSSYLWQGFSSFSVRFPSAVFGTLTVAPHFSHGEKTLFIPNRILLSPHPGNERSSKRHSTVASTNIIANENQSHLVSPVNTLTISTCSRNLDMLNSLARMDNTSKTRVAGLRENSVTFEFHQDYAAANVEASIYPLLGTATTCVVQPVSTTVTTTNPSYTFSAVVTEWQPLKGGIGQLATASVTWPVSGAITKATS
jgi:hypothetical protein